MKLFLCILLLTVLSSAQNTLKFSNAINSYPGGVYELNGVSSVPVSPDNKSVYAALMGDNALLVYNRDTLTGALTYSTCFEDGLDGVDGLKNPAAATVSPDNKNVYVACFQDSALTVFNRNTSTGALTYSNFFKNGKDDVDGLYGARSVTVSSDNKSVYVASERDSALSVYNRNTVTGALTYGTCFKNGNGVNGLGGAYSVIVSPDNKSVYVAGYGEHALAVFSRDLATGALTYITCFKDNEAGVDGLRFASSVIVSPDNKNVYVAGIGDKAVTVFNRDTGTGALTYVTCFKDGRNGVDGLYGASSVIVSPDNRYLYATGFWDNALVVFSRDTTTGALTYNMCFKDSLGGVVGMSGPWSLSVSPDNKNVYVAANNFNDGIAIFNVEHFDASLPVVSLTNPVGNEKWAAGSVRTITWTATDDIGIISYGIDLSTNNGSLFNEIHAGNGSPLAWDWALPDNAVWPQCIIRIRVKDSEGNSDSAQSTAFSIIDTIIPALRVTSPNGMERWSAGATQAITWTASDNITAVSCSIFVSTNNRVNWRPLYGGVCANGSGGKSCAMPDTFSDSCWIRIVVYDGAGNSVADISDLSFRLVSRPFFNSPDSIATVMGKSIEFRACFEIPDSAAHDISINKIYLPGWAVLDSNLVKGAPDSAGCDTVMLSLQVDGVVYDTLTLRIFVKELPVMCAKAGNRAPARFDFSINTSNRQSMVFVLSIDKASDVDIAVYSISGKELWTRQVKSIVASYKTLIWSHGGKFCAGTYFVVLKRGNERIGRKVIVTR